MSNSEIIDAVKQGDVDRLDALLLNRPAYKRLSFPLFKEWMDLLSCTGRRSIESLSLSALLKPPNALERSIIDSYLAVEFWLNWAPQKLDALFSGALGRVNSELKSVEGRHAQAHTKLVARLFVHRLQNPASYGNREPRLFVIGDSHSLVFAGHDVACDGVIHTATSMPIRGIKMFHLTPDGPEKYKRCFIERLRSMPAGAPILLSLGEIDARPNEGIFPYAFKRKITDIESLMEKTISGFAEFVSEQTRQLESAPRSISLLGVHRPQYDVRKGLPPKAQPDQFLDFIGRFNDILKQEAGRQGWKFWDSYASSQGISADNKEYVLDDFHMSPNFYKMVSK
ncbi:MAG: hypothetical protein QUV20_14830 [Oceanibaculum nanhaiense]|uniref:hypothetical protein n=1 Tax=Oceanibaculum nanhaiense TaxID=1909734 RepID=UPI0025A34F01|nr:hypothetical protein [Oceanibaculum nanhaiense]MDM7947597.1 hypothetical protein [Oceanibaculum nanhaiense]